MLPQKETLTIEFKSDLKKYSDADIFDAVVAFANTEGGNLYLGIENSGEVTGVHGSHADPTTVAAFVANNTVPPVSVRAEIIEDVFPVLRISVPKSYSCVVATGSGKALRRRLKADGSPENIPMYPTEFATRLSDLRMLDYSSMPVIEAEIDDFDPLEIARLRKIITAYSNEKSLLELTDKELFKALGLVREQNGTGHPTIAGLLLIGKTRAIAEHIPTSSVSFQVLTGTDVKVNDDMQLPLLAAIEQINNYLDAWNFEQEIEINMFRVSVPEFDRRAFREAVVNAFAHRDYTKMGRVRIQINDEGAIIANPGGFIEGISIKNLLTAEPHGRNPLLADAFKRIGLAERTGRGIDRIFESSLLYGKELPDYSATTGMTVSLFMPRSKPDIQLTKIISDEQRRIGRPLSINALLVINALKDIPKSDISAIAEYVNLQETVVRAVLEKYIEAGIVDELAGNKKISYILSEKIYKCNERKSNPDQQENIDEAHSLELIVHMAQESDFISRSDVMELLHVNDARAYNLLKKLANNGELELVNKGRYAKYRYIGEAKK